MKKILFFICSFQIITCTEYIQQFYCKIFGNNDIDNKNKELVYQAFQDFNILDYQNIPVKKMDIIGGLNDIEPLASFTAFGIWFDEKYLMQCSQEEKIFGIYHEIAHYSKKHHQKLLLFSSSFLISAMASLYFFKNKKTKLIITIILSILYFKLLIRFENNQEKEADIEAAKKLIMLQKKNIVQNYIKILEKETDQGIWWPTIQEQIKYLKKLLD